MQARDRNLPKWSFESRGIGVINGNNSRTVAADPEALEESFDEWLQSPKKHRQI